MLGLPESTRLSPDWLAVIPGGSPLMLVFQVYGVWPLVAVIDQK